MFGMATVASLTTTDALTSPACSEPAIRSTIYSAKSRSLPLRIRQARCGMPAADAGWSTHHRYSRILRSSHVTYNGRRIRNGYRCCNAEAKHCEPRCSAYSWDHNLLAMGRIGLHSASRVNSLRCQVYNRVINSTKTRPAHLLMDCTVDEPLHLRMLPLSSCKLTEAGCEQTEWENFQKLPNRSNDDALYPEAAVNGEPSGSVRACRQPVHQCCCQRWVLL